jgi:hypothetical protein
MRTTLRIEADAVLVARQFAVAEKLTLGEAVSRLIRLGIRQQTLTPPTLVREPRGRYALLPERDEQITPAHVRELMDQEGI